jgi:DNA-directed RNA polymerase specialized sigma24 family protein
MRTPGDQDDAMNTDWSLVRQAQSADPRRRQEALADLLQFYRRPLLAHLICRMRLEAALAEDLIQGFITDRILERDLLSVAAPSKGRLRNLLIRSLENYTIDQIRRRRREARGAGGPADEEHWEIVAEPERNEIDPFDAAWGREVLGQALRSMRDECLAKGCPERWQLFECRILATLTGRSKPDSYDALVQRFGFRSPQQASNLLATAKRQFRRTLESVLEEYSDTADVADELADFCRVLGSSAQPSGAIAEFLDAQVATFEDVGMSSVGSLAVQSFEALIQPQADNDSEWNDADLAAMWRQLLELSEALLLGHPRSITCDELPTDACLLPTIREMLHGARGTASDLVELKDWARAQVHQSHNGLPRELASALYFASISAARLHHDRQISKLDHSILTYGLTACRSKAWMDDATLHVIENVLTTL